MNGSEAPTQPKTNSRECILCIHGNNDWKVVVQNQNNTGLNPTAIQLLPTNVYIIILLRYRTKI